MIDASQTVFPNNVADILFTRFSVIIDPDTVDPNQRVAVLRRALRPTDPNQAVGISPVDWMPNEESKEMMGQVVPGPSEPTLQTYFYNIQTLVKDTDEVRGLAIHSILGTRARAILYRDMPLRVGLASLQVDLDGVTEQLKRYGVRAQRYVSNELQGNFLYVSTIEFWVETETR
jgi:hypothetical protein